MTLTARVPDSLYKQVESLAEREQLGMDQLVSLALSAQVSAWTTRDYLEERARRGSWEKSQAMLAKVPDVEPGHPHRTHRRQLDRPAAVRPAAHAVPCGGGGCDGWGGG